MAPFFQEFLYVRIIIVVILMVPPCHKIRKKYLCYLHLRKQNKFYNLSSCDLISNNYNQFNHTSGTLKRFFFAKRKQIKIFSISPYIEHNMLPKFKIFWKCNFPVISRSSCLHRGHGVFL